jgi:RES domain-containing protein
MPHRPAPTFDDYKGVVYRITSYDVPLWVNPNRRSGRWNIAGSHCTQYTCTDSEAPFAEALRHENLRSEEEASHYSTTLWQLQIDAGAIVDYGSFELAESAGFDPEALVEDDHERCQAEAQWLRGRGARGILSPSAALPGSKSLTLFGPRVCVPWNTSTSLASAIPAQKLIAGHPPPGLTARVRYFGAPEPLLAAYLEAREKGRSNG